MLDISETAGLGMKADEAEFKDQFKDKNVEKFTYTKTGEDGDDMIDAISGRYDHNKRPLPMPWIPRLFIIRMN